MSCRISNSRLLVEALRRICKREKGKLNGFCDEDAVAESAQLRAV
jgi:hypothetical protein